MSNEKVAQDAQYEIVAQLNDVLEQKGVKDKVLKDAQEIASLASAHILDETKDPLKTWNGVPKASDGKASLELKLVVDFLQSAGFNFATNCIKYESQQPESLTDLDHVQLAKELNLCPYDRTPCLVQVIRAMQKKE